jgi:hypothetical protein
MFLLPFHRHRKRLGNRQIIFNNGIYVHLVISQLQRRSLGRSLCSSH